MSDSDSSNENDKDGNISVPTEMQITKNEDRGKGIKNKIIVINGITSGILDDILYAIAFLRLSKIFLPS